MSQQQKPQTTTSTLPTPQPLTKTMIAHTTLKRGELSDKGNVSVGDHSDRFTSPKRRPSLTSKRGEWREVARMQNLPNGMPKTVCRRAACSRPPVQRHDVVHLGRVKSQCNCVGLRHSTSTTLWPDGSLPCLQLSFCFPLKHTHTSPPSAVSDSASFIQARSRALCKCRACAVRAHADVTAAWRPRPPWSALPQRPGASWPSGLQSARSGGKVDTPLEGQASNKAIVDQGRPCCHLPSCPKCKCCRSWLSHRRWRKMVTVIFPGSGAGRHHDVLGNTCPADGQGDGISPFRAAFPKDGRLVRGRVPAGLAACVYPLVPDVVVVPNAGSKCACGSASSTDPTVGGCTRPSWWTHAPCGVFAALSCKENMSNGG